MKHEKPSKPTDAQRLVYRAVMDARRNARETPTQLDWQKQFNPPTRSQRPALRDYKADEIAEPEPDDVSDLLFGHSPIGD